MNVLNILLYGTEIIIVHSLYNKIFNDENNFSTNNIAYT